MKRLARLTPGKIAALATLGVVVLVLAISGGGLFSPGELSAEHRRDIQRGGVSAHAEIGGHCSACHAPPWSSETMADRCMACHTEIRHERDQRQPLHGTLSAGTRCQNCHTEHRGAHAALTDISRFDHNGAAFKLDGKHLQVNCNSCHSNKVYKATPQSCVGCHSEPKVPLVHRFNYGTGCAQCHTTTTWKTPDQSGFDHSRTAFQLTGKHTAVSCHACHKNNVYQGTPMTCVGCHSEPTVPVVHKFNYGNHCTPCHTTSAWTGAAFQHSAFPISHGKRNGNTCATCHQNPDHFKLYTCYNCHEHRPAKIEAIHVKRKIENFQDCVKCHHLGRGREKRERELGGILGDAGIAFPCPGDADECGQIGAGGRWCGLCPPIREATPPQWLPELDQQDQLRIR